MLGQTITNTNIFPEEWEVRLQQQLDEPTKWKRFMDVKYTDKKTYNNPYQTDIAVQSHIIGTAYTPQTSTETNESVSLTKSFNYPVYIDRADEIWSYDTQMYHAERAAVLLNEQIETSIYADHANRTDFGATDAANGAAADTTQISVSVTNIDDIILNLLRVVSVQAGDTLLERNGFSIVWRPSDFLLVKQFAMANGFNEADYALKTGLKLSQSGLDYMGATHYSSNLLTANHVYAGVNGVYTLAILTGTYGRFFVADGESAGFSGKQINSRVDFNVKAWNLSKPVLSTIVRQLSPARVIEKLLDIGEALTQFIERVIPREPQFVLGAP